MICRTARERKLFSVIMFDLQCFSTRFLGFLHRFTNDYIMSWLAFSNSVPYLCWHSSWRKSRRFFVLDSWNLFNQDRIDWIAHESVCAISSLECQSQTRNSMSMAPQHRFELLKCANHFPRTVEMAFALDQSRFIWFIHHYYAKSKRNLVQQHWQMV